MSIIIIVLIGLVIFMGWYVKKATDRLKKEQRRDTLATYLLSQFAKPYNEQKEFVAGLMNLQASAKTQYAPFYIDDYLIVMIDPAIGNIECHFKYEAIVPAFPNIFISGNNYQQLTEDLKMAIDIMLEEYRQQGLLIPPKDRKEDSHLKVVSID